MKGFCYRCGYEGDLIEGLCSKCYSQLNPLIEVPNEIKVEVCHMCGSYKRKTWQDPKEQSLYEILDEIAYSAVKDNIKKLENDVKIDIIPNEPQQLPGGKKSRVVIPVSIECFGKSPNEKEYRTEKKEVTVYLTMVQCPRCSRYMSNYYEATLQIRAMNRFLTDEERKELDEFVRSEVDKRLKKDRMAFISKFIQQKEGLDYQIGSMGGARNIASAIKSKYGGKTQETAKLVGVEKDTGKNQYRITIVVRIPEYSVGDIVEYKDKPYKVLSMNENKLFMEDIGGKGDKISLNWNEVEKETKLIKKLDDCTNATVISVSPTTIVAMDDKTYETYEYDRLDRYKNISEGDSLKIYRDDIKNTTYIVDVVNNKKD